jgi:hypothetical protein
LRTNLVREPDAGKPHVRFDERGWETELRSDLRHRYMVKTAGTATPPTYGHRAHPRLYRF